MQFMNIFLINFIKGGRQLCITGINRVSVTGKNEYIVSVLVRAHVHVSLYCILTGEWTQAGKLFFMRMRVQEYHFIY